MGISMMVGSNVWFGHFSSGDAGFDIRSLAGATLLGGGRGFGVDPSVGPG